MAENAAGRAAVPSVKKAAAAVRRLAHTAYDSALSIAEDGRFVREIAALYPNLPVLANLRCGLWYTMGEEEGTCYFKSTDGHQNHVDFSRTRVNLDVRG